MKNVLLTCVGLVTLAIITTGLWSATSSAHPEPEASPRPDDVSNYEQHSIEDILTHSTDDELVKISGEIIEKIKCSTYLFRGETGDIQIRINTDVIPDRGIPFKEAMVVKGAVLNDGSRPPKVEADHIRFVF